MFPDRAEVVVVGAGVVGMAVARSLARLGREVVVLEAARACGTGVTSRSSEVIHAGFHYPPGSLKARLCLAGRDLLYRYCAEHGVGHRRLEKLVVATDDKQIAVLESLRVQGERAGVSDLRLLDGAEARRLEPALACRAALHSPSTGIVDAHGLVRALRAEAEAHGAVVALTSQVVGGWAGGEGVGVEVGAERSRLACAALVNAAGLGAHAVAASVGGIAPELIPTLHPVKGNYFQLEGRAPFSRLIYPVPGVGGIGIHLTLDLGGAARFGPDVEPLGPRDPQRSGNAGDGLDPFDYAVDVGREAAFVASVRRFWPQLGDGALRPGFAGVRPRITPPGLPLSDFVVMGPSVHQGAGLVHLFGIESPGLTAALALGEHVAAMLQG